MACACVVELLWVILRVHSM